jgi:GNAT superfamily N-acetyltransferase
MTRRIVPLTVDTLADVPLPCAQCAFWELGPVNRFAPGTPAPHAVAKRAWVASTVSGWGACGLVGYVDDTPAGFVTYAPPAYVPRAQAFPTAPISSDAVLLMALRVRPEASGTGLGRALVQAMAKDLLKRGVRAIEAYGGTGERCLLPVGYLEAVGFVTVRDHARNPRLRLDLRTTVTWREDVEGAWERLVGVVRPFPAGARQAGAVPGAPLRQRLPADQVG